MSDLPIKVGLNARLFPNNWRPALQEIEFARAAGFRALQFPGKENGLDEESLSSSFPEVVAALNKADIDSVMEIIVRLGIDGRTAFGHTPLEILKANLDAILQLGCTYVHWHLVLQDPNAIRDISLFELGLVPQFHQAVELAQGHGFTFGFEHNEPDLLLFGEPQSCRTMVEAVDDLAFVWDVNHTTLEHLSKFKELTSHMSMLHISDTLLPEVNYHLPIGLGNIDFVDYFKTLIQGGFSGVGILEIGGLPKSGGYGRDTDEALIMSLERIQRAVEIANNEWHASAL
jgi:L-ribulose-5-phosphate 3-epimerase